MEHYVDVIIAEMVDDDEVEGWECRLCGKFIPHSLPHGDDPGESEYAIEGSYVREHLRIKHGVNAATTDDLAYIVVNKLLEMDEEKENKCKPA